MDTGRRLAAVLILMLTLISDPSAVAQHQNQLPAIEPQAPHLLIHGYMQIHEQYMDAHNPLKNGIRRNQQNMGASDLNYLPDTFSVNSVTNNPQRYLYSYNLAGLRVSTELQEIKNGNWTQVSIEICTYDAAGNKLTSHWLAWDPDTHDWVDATKYTYTYTIINKMATSLRQVWTNGVWTNADKGTFSYDSDGNVVSYLKEIWQAAAWRNYSFELYTYDQFSNMLTATGQIWTNNSWYNDVQYTYTYDGSNNMLTSIREIWEDGGWKNFLRKTYTYNTANNRTSYLGEEWDNDAWKNKEREVYTYNSFDYLVLNMSETWQVSAWQYDFKYQYFYGVYGGIETLLIESWEATDWGNYSLSQYTFDNYGNALVGKYFSWDGNTWAQDDGDIEMFYNFSRTSESKVGYQINASYTSLLVGINDAQIDETLSFICYPNPATSHTNVSVEMEKESDVTINLSDLNGKKIQSVFQGTLSAGKHQYIIVTGHLPAATYVVSLSNAFSKESRRILVTK